MNVLIVDDSPAVRTSLRTLLGCITGVGTVCEVDTLSAALDNIRRDPPALVILDLHLPDGLGDTLLPTFKRLAPRMCIAVFSFCADNSYQQQCLAQGADWFFDKATQVDDLFDRLLLEAQRFAPNDSDLIDLQP